MRNCLTSLPLLAAVILAAGCSDQDPIPPPATAPDFAALGTPADASANPIDLAVIGDAPYGAVATERFPELIERINRDPKVRRVIHLGDIKSGSTPCSDEWYDFIATGFATFTDPLVYTPGDNEWTDCHRANNGGYDPLERLDRIREVFFNEPGVTLGARGMRMEAQVGYPENQLWIESRVVFAALHVVGSNNGRAPWSGLTELTPAQEAEWAARDAANRRWLDRAFDLAEEKGAAGVAIFLQADMWSPGAPADADVSGHQRFVELLAARAAAISAPVVLVVGDSHRYRVDRPLVGDTRYGISYDVPNLTQITIEQSIRDQEIVWLRLHVDPRAPEIFRWEEVR